MAKLRAAPRVALAALLAVPLCMAGCSHDTGTSSGASLDASLASLTLSTGGLRPEQFGPETLSYFLDVPFGTTTFTVTPTAADASASITVAQDGGAPVAVPNGAPSQPLAAPAIDQRSVVTVTVKVGSRSTTYGFMVTRLVGRDATLSGLALGEGELSPAFAPGTSAYAAALPAGTATVTVTPTAKDPSSTLTVAQDSGEAVSIASGATTTPLPVPAAGATTTIKVKVTAQDGTTSKTYTVVVSQLSSNVATLSNLTDSAGALAFAPGTSAYAYDVPFQQAYTLTATPTSPRATVKVNGAAVAGGTPSPALTLAVGAPTTITLEVTAQDGTTTATYTLLVTEGRPAGLVNARNVPTGWSSLEIPGMGSLLPGAGATEVPYDTLLRIKFDAPPALGSTGTPRTIKIYQDGVAAPVDTIDLAEAYVPYDIGNKYFPRLNTRVNVIGGTAANVDAVRVVNYLPVIIYGDTAVIFPHNNKLLPATKYYVTIDGGVLVGKIGGQDFPGFSAPTDWSFTTKAAIAAPTAAATLYVAADGSRDFATVQGALDALSKGSAVPVTISIAPGTYHELLFLRSKSNVTLQGSGSDGTATVIQYDNCDAFNPGTGNQQSLTGWTGLSVKGGGRAVVYVAGGTGIVLDTVTLKNLHASGTAGFVLPDSTPLLTADDTVITTSASPTFTNGTSQVTQAEALYFNVSYGTSTNPPTEPGTLVAKHANFVGYQDTLQLKGWSWIYDSFVTGDTDFIWGNASTALFERCEIKSRYNTNAPSIVQPRAYLGWGTAAAAPATSTAAYAGFVFLDSAFTKEDGAFTSYLARQLAAPSASAAGTNYLYTGYDLVALVNCSLDAHIPAAGWSSTGANVPPTAVTGWREHRSFTPGGQWIDTTGRLPALPTGTTPYNNGSLQLTDAAAATFFGDRTRVLGGATDGTSTLTGRSDFTPTP
jgi:pectin methylesterase-like acyl-CoA thioesterase